ncbi:hypothetical protein C8R45DRAFT_818153, partial [Mycena sanguinolenta]
FVATAATKNLNRWMDTGWIGFASPELMKAFAAELFHRMAKTTFSKMKITQGTTEAIALAKKGKAKPQAAGISLSTSATSCLPGAKLSKMTQSLAYKRIKVMREPVSRKATDENVKNIQAAIKNIFGFTPTPSAIWKQARSRDLTPNIRNFLWKSIHNAHRVGKYWTHIPECEDRAQCKHCRAEESLEHTLTGQTYPLVYYSVLAWLSLKTRQENLIRHLQDCITY